MYPFCDAPAGRRGLPRAPIGGIVQAVSTPLALPRHKSDTQLAMMSLGENAGCA